MRIGGLTSRLPSSARFGEPASLIQTSGGAYNVDGRWSGEVETVLDITACVQPASKDDRLIVDPGNRVDEMQTVYITSLNRNDLRPLRVGTSATNADVIVVNDLRYIVRGVQDFATHGHIMAVVTREDGQDG